MTDWQPIETAPRDGTEFLAFDSTTGKMDVCTMESYPSEWYAVPVQYDSEYGPLNGEFYGDIVGSDGRTAASRIVHWMPLPEPPK